MLRGERVILRPTERADLPRFDRHLAQPPEGLVEFVIDVEGGLVGSCQLHAIDRFHRRCDLGIALGRDYWGKGYGQDAVRVLVDYAFNQLDMRRVGLRVLAHDARAIGAYRKAGFVEEGRLRDYSLFDGQPRDDLLMGILRDDAAR